MNDILLDTEYNIKVVNGDFVIGNSDEQNVDLLLNLNKGHLREEPLVGIGIDKYINSINSFPNLRNIINSELQKDGYSLTLFYFDKAKQKLIVDFN